MKGIDQKLLREVRDCISTRFGIYYTDERLPELSDKLVSICTRMGFHSPTGGFDALLKGDLKESQLHQFIETITVGETYFFREPEALEAIVSTIIPALPHNRNRRLRIWVAGCASGEEPYSVAMILHSRLPEFAKWDISILATDLNRSFLRKAEEAVYTSWSFRTIPRHLKSRYFHKLPDGSYKLDKTIREMVRFEQLNLVTGHFPSPLNGTQDCDIILCRNVLMYFAPETISTIAARLARSLYSDGWMIVSQTECSVYFDAEFDSIQTGNVFLYRKKTLNAIPAGIVSAGLVTRPILQKPGFSPPIHIPDNAAGDERPLFGQESNVPPEAPATATSAEPFLQARTLADEGRLPEACACCESGLASKPLSIHGHYLHAAILQEQGKPEEARNALRKVLYIDPDAVMAMYALGILEQKLGNRKAALSFFDKAARAMTAYEDEQLLPEAEGLTAGHLKEFIDAIRKG